MAHRRIRPFNARDTYPGKDFDTGPARAAGARGGSTGWMRGQCPEDLDTARSLDSTDPAERTRMAMRIVPTLIEEAGGGMEHRPRWSSTSPTCGIARPRTAPWASICAACIRSRPG